MREEEYDLCFSPPLPPTVWGELSLCFDVDFPIDTVSSILGVQPTEAKRQRACRWNAYAGTQNPGYWTITFDKTDTFDGDVVQRRCILLSQNTSGRCIRSWSGFSRARCS